MIHPSGKTWLAFDIGVSDLCSPLQNNRIDYGSRVHLSFQSIDNSEQAGLGRETFSRYKTREQEFNKAVGTCKALGDFLMSSFIMCVAHSDSWRLIWKNKMHEVFQTSGTFDSFRCVGVTYGTICQI